MPSLSLTARGWNIEMSMDKCKEKQLEKMDKAEIHMISKNLPVFDIDFVGVDKRFLNSFIYIVFQNTKIMKVDMNFNQHWIVNIEVERKELPINCIAFAPQNEILFVISSLFVRISIKNGSVIGGFEVTSLKHRIRSVAKSTNQFLNEIVVYYEEGEIWNIDILNKRSFWYGFQKFNLMHMFYSVSPFTTNNANNKKLLGIQTDSLLGIINIENIANSAIYGFHLCYGSSPYIPDWVYGDVEANDEDYSSLVFYLTNLFKKYSLFFNIYITYCIE